MQLEQEWDRARAWYDRQFARLDSPDYAQPDDGVVWLGEELPSGALVAEPACGAGRNTIELARAGLKVTAFDNSPCAIQRLGEFAARRKCTANISACQRNLRDGFPPGPWDAVVISHILQELTAEEAAAMLAAAQEHTADGGYHAIAVYLKEPWREALFEGSFVPLQADELLRHYGGWNLVRFRERPMDMGLRVYEAILQRP